jgi:hypothetical protein
MIRAGRDVVDTYGIAELRGEDYYHVTNARPRPWDQPGWPAPVNPENTRKAGTIGRGGGRKRLWDRAQVEAFLAGKPVPAINAADHDEDLLDVIELAAVLGLPPKQVNELLRQGRLDGPDATPCGVKHWTRGHARTMQPAPPEWSQEDGRPRGEDAEQIRARLLVAVEKVPRRAGGKLNASAIARAANVHRHTARRFLEQLDAEGGNAER